MLRNSLAALAFACTLSWAGASFAFDPIAFAETPSMVGKPVYASGNKSLGNGKRWVYAGDVLTLVEAKPFGGQGTFNYVKVRTKEGAEGEIQIRFLSKTPLKYSLSNPGNPKAFLKALLEDAYPLGAKMHALREKHGYNLSLDSADDYHQVDALKESFTFARSLLHGLVHGATRDKVDILRDDETKWLGGGDGTLLGWYADGMDNAALKQNFVNAVLALNELDAVNDHGSEAARATSEKEKKEWLNDLKDAPAATRAKVDSEKVQALDKRIADKKKKLAASFADAAKLKARVK